MIYLTISPHLFYSNPTFPDLRTLSEILILLSVSLLTGVILKRKAAGQGRGKVNLLCALLPVLTMTILILTKGPSMTTLKGFLLFLVLFQASVSDIRTREVPDNLSLLILLIALIDRDLSEIPSMLMALVFVGLPQLIVAMAKPGAYGGADIKITASGAFLLGVWKGLFAMITGMTAAIIIPILVRTLKKQSIHEGIPMIPYLSFGIALAFII